MTDPLTVIIPSTTFSIRVKVELNNFKGRRKKLIDFDRETG